MMSQKIGLSLRGTLHGIYCLNYVIFDVFDVIFDIFCSAMIPGYQHGPYIRAVYTGVQTTPVYTARTYGRIFCTRMYGPYVRPVYTGSVYRPLRFFL